MVFIMGPQFKFTGPSLRGISTELSKNYTLGHGIPHTLGIQDLLKPVFYVIQLSTRDRVDLQRRTSKVREDEYHIELLQAELHTFQRSDFNLAQSDDEEWRIGKMNKTFCRWLQFDVCTERNAFEGEFTEGNVRFNCVTGL